MPDEFPRGTNQDHIWTDMGRGRYDSSKSKGSQFKDPAVCTLHYILARSTTGRGDSQGVVSASDLYQLWSMTTGTRVNVGLVAVWCLKKQCDLGHQEVFVGSWITRIIKNYGFFPARAPKDSVGHSHPMPEGALKRWKVLPANPETP